MQIALTFRCFQVICSYISAILRIAGYGVPALLKLQTSSPTGTGNGNTDIRVAVSGNLQCRSRHFSISFPIYVTHFITQLIIHYLAK
jgi:hypothetical protein